MLCTFLAPQSREALRIKPPKRSRRRRPASQAEPLQALGGDAQGYDCLLDVYIRAKNKGLRKEKKSEAIRLKTHTEIM